MIRDGSDLADDQASYRQRKTYQKPKLRTIDLTVGETLTLGCKTAAGGFSFDVAPCDANNCSQAGS